MSSMSQHQAAHAFAITDTQQHNCKYHTVSHAQYAIANAMILIAIRLMCNSICQPQILLI